MVRNGMRGVPLSYEYMYTSFGWATALAAPAPRWLGARAPAEVLPLRRGGTQRKTPRRRRPFESRAANAPPKDGGLNQDPKESEKNPLLRWIFPDGSAVTLRRPN